MFRYCRRIVSSVHGALKKIAFNKSRSKSKLEPPPVNNSAYLSDVSDTSDIDDYNEPELLDGADKECGRVSSTAKKVKLILKDSKENNITDIKGNEKKHKNKGKEIHCCGQCTCSVSSRFLHPGVTDNVNCTIFDMVRPIAYPPHAATSHEFCLHAERSSLVRPLSAYSGQVHAPKPENYSLESAWEQGFRYANQMMRMAQEEMYQDSRYYKYPSPEPPNEYQPVETKGMSRRFAPPSHEPVHNYDSHYDDYPASEYYSRIQYEADCRTGPEYRGDYHAVPRGDPHSVLPPPYPRERKRKRKYYEKYEKKYKSPSREGIVERILPKTWREEEAPRVKRRRDNKWADPWMEQNSPSSVRKMNSSRRSTRQAYSSGSPYSSRRPRSPSPCARPRGYAKGKHSHPSNNSTSSTEVRNAMPINPPSSHDSFAAAVVPRVTKSRSHSISSSDSRASSSSSTEPPIDQFTTIAVQKRQHEESPLEDNAAAKKLCTREAVDSRNKFLLEKIRACKDTIGLNI